jgi:Fic family protein
MERPFLSQTVIKAINFHAIACLHTKAGEYRPCRVTVGAYEPPEYFRVSDLMDDFVNTVNRRWDGTEPTYLSAYVLWRLNHIHPFINGNGRTARAACHFVLCVKAGGWLGGQVIVPELLRQNRLEYVHALQAADAAAKASGDYQTPDLNDLCDLINRLLIEQRSHIPDLADQASPNPQLKDVADDQQDENDGQVGQ